ncbi:hypothetical protein N7468_009888 [Penicillium chermesinum]|uniref:Uncharacterized protein n=1 Tax=Penicillium chermesinum TaxID=63820 RepID=A0A9W9NBN3_9EURO|nr:uncharacterized protein N7468_009888 [Penicillium chermesinum]KAJ5216880.1 hypothetical protein N7468_009888 [Penicillium chermesinum]
MQRLLLAPRRKLTVGAQRLSSPSQVIVVLTGSTCASVDMAVETTLCSWQDDPQIETTLVDLRDRQMLSPTAQVRPAASGAFNKSPRRTETVV